MSNRAPDLAEVLKAFIRSERRSMFGGWLPGRIETFDSAKLKASVLLLIKEPFTHEDGSADSELFPMLHEVPVQMPGDGKGIRLEVDLAKGDYVTVFFASRSVDRWLQQGGIVEPGDVRDHDLSDAICYPGLLDFAHVKRPTARIKFTASTIEAGGTNALGRKSDLQAIETAIAGADATTVATFKATVIAGLATSLHGSTGTTPWPVGTDVLKGG